MPPASPAEPPPRSIAARIRAHHAALSPKEQRLAEVVLNFSGRLAGYSAGELAAMAETSGAAVTRFVRRLGFASYEEMRRLARELEEAGTPLHLLDQPDGLEGGFLADHLEAGRRNLAATLEPLDPQVVEAVAAAMKEARRIWIFGQRNGFFLAGYLRWQLVQVRGGVQVVPGAGETLGESLAAFAPDDLLIVFGLRRRVPAIAGVMRQARRVGLRSLFIADQGLTEDPGATWTLRCDTRSRAPLDNHLGVLALIHVLAERLIRALGPAARRRLAEVDALHEELGEL